ncbi:MAG: hypothetical protein M0R44_02360 [Candidatus Marinimicrobia bacterium]|nr:hypothetical protein [Candidatus Neomarinimicrobiota bacterium]
MEWPKGSGLSPIFAAGQFLCAKIDGEIRAAGVQHSATEYQPGLILTTDNADDKNDTKYRWYELHKDGSGDWSDWPVSQGAPINENGDPLLLGDMTIYSVWNDLTDHGAYGSNPLNAEIHQLAWAFDRSDQIGDMIFQKWTIVNKSGKTWDDAYFAIWCDPDLGNGGDDQVGCDTTLGLGYCWNATDNDQNYGDDPPAVGFVFLQGPMTTSEGDNVYLPDGRVFVNKKVINMSAFRSYNSDDSPKGDPSNAMQIYNFMQGLWKDGSVITEGDDGTDQNNPPTKFMYSGDPESGTGWLDSNPADRRFFMSTGPFTMEPWVDSDVDGVAEFGEPGVQEIVAAVIVARGTSNLNSVTELKRISGMIRSIYDMNFELSKPPRQPFVTASALPNEIILTWDERSEYNEDGSPYESVDPVAAVFFGDTMIIDNTIKIVDDSTYNFYGYTVYQYSDAAGSDAVEVNSLNIGNITDATKYSKQRFIRILTNYNSEVGPVGDTLINGKEYYFGITADAYLEYSYDQIISSDATIESVTPCFVPGIRYNSGEDSSLAVSYKAVNSSIPAGDGLVEVTVIDPSQTTGLYYRINFNNDDTWNLVSASDSNFTSVDTVLKNQINQEGDDAYNVVDGLLVKVISPAAGIKRIAELNPSSLAIYDANLWASLNNYGRSQQWPLFVLTEDIGTDLGRVDQFGLMTPKDYDIIFTATDSTLIWDYSTNLVLIDTLSGCPSYVPLTVWKIDLNGTRTRLPVCILDADLDGTWNRSLTDEGIFGPAFEALYIYDNAEYVPSNVAIYISSNDGTVAPGYGPYGVVNPSINSLMFNMYIDIDNYAQVSDLDSNDYFYGPPHAGEYIRIITNKPNTINDVFVFKAPDACKPVEVYLKEDLKKINVVPNPYYGYHSGDLNGSRWVRFTFLPEECTVKIFDLAGHLVRQFEKADATTPFLDWDLTNHYGATVASGIYIYHVEVPGIGEKVGKMAVFISIMK